MKAESTSGLMGRQNISTPGNGAIAKAAETSMSKYSASDTNSLTLTGESSVAEIELSDQGQYWLALERSIQLLSEEDKLHVLKELKQNGSNEERNFVSLYQEDQGNRLNIDLSQVVLPGSESTSEDVTGVVLERVSELQKMGLLNQPDWPDANNNAQSDQHFSEDMAQLLEQSTSTLSAEQQAILSRALKDFTSHTLNPARDTVGIVAQEYFREKLLWLNTHLPSDSEHSISPESLRHFINQVETSGRDQQKSANQLLKQRISDGELHPDHLQMLSLTDNVRQELNNRSGKVLDKLADWAALDNGLLDSGRGSHDQWLQLFHDDWQLMSDEVYRMKQTDRSDIASDDSESVPFNHNRFSEAHFRVHSILNPL